MAEATRVSFGRALARLGSDPRIVVLDADLASSTNTKPFADKYPERFFQLGIAEGNILSCSSLQTLIAGLPSALHVIHTDKLYRVGLRLDAG